jgi:hypothetical protein
VNELNTRGGRLASLKTGSNIMRMMMRKEDAGNEVPLRRSNFGAVIAPNE